jgi:hypothetical protein
MGTRQWYSNTSMTPTSSLLKVIRRSPSRPQKQPPDPDIEAISRSVVVDGAEHVVSYGGTSQYNRDGTGASACGLAALNFARIVFSMEQSGLQDTTLLQAVLARACAEVRRRYSNPLVSVHRLISTGNHGYMRIVVGQPSSRSRRYLSRSLVQEDFEAEDNRIRPSWSLRVQIVTHVSTRHCY